MNENEYMRLAWSLVAGLGCGLFFYGGLWWTVRTGTHASAPGLLFLISFLVRMGIAVAGFYLASAGNWKGILICLVGFLIARVIITRISRTQPKKT